MVAKHLALVLPLGLDTFAVAAALGVGGLAPGRRLRVSVLMTSFETGMPLVGLALDAPLGRAIGSAANYLAIAALLAFGLYTLLSAEQEEEERVGRLGNVTGFRAVLLGLSISLDEFAIGFTLWAAAPAGAARHPPRRRADIHRLAARHAARYAPELPSARRRRAALGRSAHRPRLRAAGGEPASGMSRRTR